MRRLSILSGCLVLALGITQLMWTDVTSDIARGADAISESPMVQTPYGLVPRSRVNEVDSDEIVRVVGNRVVKFDLNTGAKLADLGPASDTPSEDNPHASINSLRTSAAAAEQNFAGKFVSAPAQHIKEFRTTWTVPPKPTNPNIGNSVLYFWNGLSNGGLQPVLEYRKVNGISQYMLANWYILGGTYDSGKRAIVAPGTTITGVITFMGMSDGKYVYKLSFVGYPVADVTVARNTVANGVAECFEPWTQSPAEWPNADKIRMRDIKLTMQAGYPTPSTLTWSPGGKRYPTASGKNTVIVNNSSQSGVVDFYFR